jgi:AAA+ ATPase superfamily predicted ATPase
VLAIIIALTLLISLLRTRVGHSARTRQAIERKFNPYISGGPVREPDMFFGREELLGRIINTLHNNSIMIHGPRRIGKTSLLYQLANRLRATSDPDYAFLPALIDLEGTAQEEFFHTLMEEILEGCQPDLAGRLPLAYNEKGEREYTHRDFARDLRTLIGHLQQNSDKEVRLILLLDEVDVMNRYDQLVQQQLRRVFMKTFARNLGVVVTGVHISKEWDRLESPWYNLFLEMELPPLSLEEVVRLIKEPVKGVYSYDDEAVEAIWEYSQGHPQLVQQLCLEAVNRLLQEKRSRVTKADVESVYQETVAWEKAQEGQKERERARPLVKRVAEEGPTYEAEEDTNVWRDDR